MTSTVSLISHASGPGAQLILNGTDISDQVTGLNLYVEPGTLAQRLELYLQPGSFAVELLDTEVYVDADTHDLLVRLGWTPPAQ